MKTISTSMALVSLFTRIWVCLRAIWERTGSGNSRLHWTSAMAGRQAPWRAGEVRLRKREAALLRSLWFDLKDEVGLVTLEQEDILHFALEELNMSLCSPQREDILLMLLFKLRDTFHVPEAVA